MSNPVIDKALKIRPKLVGASFHSQRHCQVNRGWCEEARRAKFSGNVLVSLWVDEKGIPSHVHVVHSVGMGLDEKAIESVKNWSGRMPW